MELAERYEAGRGVRKDLERACHWAFAAAKRGDEKALQWLRERTEGSGDAAPFAKFYLAVALGISDYDQQQGEVDALLEAALPVLRTRAEKGDAPAQHVIGIAYDSGWGVDASDDATAVLWFEKAAASGLGHSCYSLGLIYSSEKSPMFDAAKALEWYRKGAELGDPGAQNNLARMYFDGQATPRDRTKALEWYRRSAAQGNATAQSNLGHAYYHGDGVPQDYAAAAEWTGRAARQGYPTAQHDLGVMYEKGQGVPRDPRQALTWYEKAAKSGDAASQVVLGDAYRDGEGMPQDYSAASKWYRLAAESGNESAKPRLEQLNQVAECRTNASTKLFGVSLKCALRGELRNAVRGAGGEVEREDSSYWYDLYGSSALLRDSKALGIGYVGRTGEFAKARYTFPSHMDRAQVKRIADMVATKYGPPPRSVGSIELGEVSYEWVLDDGINVRVYRGWPNTTTYLEFTHVDNNRAMEREMDKNKQREAQQEAERQSDAF